MKIIKETQGFVRQIFDLETGQLEEQDFIATNERTDFYNTDDPDVDIIDTDISDEDYQNAVLLYAPFTMKQSE